MRKISSFLLFLSLSSFTNLAYAHGGEIVYLFPFFGLFFGLALGVFLVLFRLVRYVSIFRWIGLGAVVALFLYQLFLEKKSGESIGLEMLLFIAAFLVLGLYLPFIVGLHGGAPILESVRRYVNHWKRLRELTRKSK